MGTVEKARRRSPKTKLDEKSRNHTFRKIAAAAAFSTKKSPAARSQKACLSLRCDSSVSDIELTTKHSLAGIQQYTDALIPVHVALGIYSGSMRIYSFSTASTRRMRVLTAKVLSMPAVCHMPPVFSMSNPENTQYLHQYSSTEPLYTTNARSMQRCMYDFLAKIMQCNKIEFFTHTTVVPGPTTVTTAYCLLLAVVALASRSDASSQTLQYDSLKMDDQAPPRMHLLFGYLHLAHNII